MCPGINTDLDQIQDVRKTAIISEELNELGVDIAALQETRLAETGSLREAKYTFFWCGKDFAVKSELLGKIEALAAVSSRLMRLRLSLKSGFVSIVCAYAPTLTASHDVKDEFYDALSAVLHQIPNSKKLTLLGDCNARVGSDDSAWPSCLGKHGIGKVNENGQRLLELCAQFQLCITGTFFANKHHRKVSWRCLAPVTGTNSTTLSRGDMIYLTSTTPALSIVQTATPIIPLFAASSNLHPRNSSAPNNNASPE